MNSLSGYGGVVGVQAKALVEKWSDIVNDALEKENQKRIYFYRRLKEGDNLPYQLKMFVKLVNNKSTNLNNNTPKQGMNHDQKKNIDHVLPSSTDTMWKSDCLKRFASKLRYENESWKDMFMVSHFKLHNLIFFLCFSKF